VLYRRNYRRSVRIVVGIRLNHLKRAKYGYPQRALPPLI
jgi:hypothetical protein